MGRCIIVSPAYAASQIAQQTKKIQQLQSSRWLGFNFHPFFLATALVRTSRSCILVHLAGYQMIINHKSCKGITDVWKRFQNKIYFQCLISLALVGWLCHFSVVWLAWRFHSGWQETNVEGSPEPLWWLQNYNFQKNKTIGNAPYGNRNGNL